MDVNTFIKTIASVQLRSFQDEADRRQALDAARALYRRFESPMETIIRTCWVEPATVLAAKICKEVDMFSKMLEGEGRPKSTQELAKATGTDAELAARFLRHLSTVDFVIETGPEEYAPNALSSALAEPSVNGGLDFLFDVYLPSLVKLPDFFEEKGYANPLGVPGPFQYAMNTSGSLFAWYSQYPKKVQNFQNHMAGYTNARPGWLDIFDMASVIDGYDPSKSDVLQVDVGGGYGQDLDRFVSRFPDAPGRLVLQEQAHIVEKATETPRIEKVVHDFFTPQPIKGARVYLLHSILHDYDDAKCKEILENLKPALVKGYSKLLMNENVIPAIGANPAATSLDLIMMCNTGAAERKESQWKTLLASAGYRIVQVHTSLAIESVIEAELAS